MYLHEAKQINDLQISLLFHCVRINFINPRTMSKEREYLLFVVIFNSNVLSSIIHQVILT